MSLAYTNRPLTDQERAWLVCGLKTLETGEYAGGGNWIDLLRIIDSCSCSDPNCHMIRLERIGSRVTPALVTYHTEDGRMLNVLIEDTEVLAELEII